MSPEKRGTSAIQRPPATSLSGLRCAASTRKAWVCNLVSGTAKPFDAFRQSPAFHAAIGSQGLRNRQGVRGRRIIDGTHVPKRARPVLRKGAAVEAHNIS